MTRAEIEKKALTRAALTALLLLVLFTWMKAAAQTVVVGNSAAVPSTGTVTFGTDTGLSRDSAGVVGVGNGTQGSLTGFLKMLGYQTGGGNQSSDMNFTRAGLSLGINAPIVMTASNVSASPDTSISRPSAALVAFGNGTNGDFSGSTKSTTDILGAPNGETWTRGSSTELLTLAAAASTDTTGNLLPANSIIEAVVVRVTTVIPTAATFSVGDATTAARFATGVAVAATTTAVGLTHVDQTGAAGPKQTAAAKVRITPNLTPGTATGVVRITVYYRTFVPPTQ